MASQPEFTAGPWRYEPDFKEIHGGPLSEYKILAQISPENRPGDFIDDDETEANARLIAAAPDLLAALKARMSPAVGEAEIEACFAAIDKAEGRS